ncbi:Z1 domain-containing protein [Corynebacterium sanguinis]
MAPSSEFEQAVEDYLEDFENASRSGRDLYATAKRLIRRHEADLKAIREAQSRVERKLNLPNSQRHNAIYDRGGTFAWYTTANTDVFWPTLRTTIEANLGPAIEHIDSASTNVINGLLPSSKPQNTRGLVLGYVQSGKTTNFMSVIAKAADAGFRLIIVLTGITDNLRQQTQDRLDEQLVGPVANRWTRLTDHDSDFSGDKNGRKLANQNDRFIAVVKKNAHRLRRLNEWINDAGIAGDECPILVIDDEADQASIDVSNRSKNERSAINRQITQLLDHEKTAYIAYTATPFANILIDVNNEVDLYPRDFIVTLPEPEGYFGSRRLFGRAPIGNEDPEELGDKLHGYDMIRTITSEEAAEMRPSADSSDGELSFAGGPALSDAIRWFVMATAARKVRGQGDEHSSMLVHTSMLTADHAETQSIVDAELQEVSRELNDASAIQKWENQWLEESRRVPADLFNLQPVSFQEIEPLLRSVAGEVKTIVDNGRSLDRLDYSSGAKTVIAIGGNTLSRGLTLEGLVSSYFVRKASAYDTLLQMGRWFGFRRGYEDLPRIWMPEELQRWFYDLATIEAELRDELSVYMDEGKSPLEVQARIRTHPDMEVTSRAKMQDARSANMSFAGKKEQTIKFKHRDSSWLENNERAVRSLIQEIQKRGIEEETGLYESPVFRRVPPDVILEFLSQYNIHEDTRLGRSDADLLKNYIRHEAECMRLKHWNVSFITKKAASNTETVDLGLNQPIQTITRAKLRLPSSDDANIKALVTTSDRLNDIVLPTEERRAALREEVSAESEGKSAEGAKRRGNSESTARRMHEDYVGPGIGHLAIYPIDPVSTPRGWKKLDEQSQRYSARVPLDALGVVYGLGLFFPEARAEEAVVEYVTAPSANDEALHDFYEKIDSEIRLINKEDEENLRSDELADRE